MRLQLSLADLDSLKGDLFHTSPEIPYTRRIEGAARALGFKTYNGLRAALSEEPQFVEPNDEVYAAFLQIRSTADEPIRDVSRAVARIAVRKVLDTVPQLTEQGFDSWYGNRSAERKMTPSERKAAFQARRKAALGNWAMDQFELAWIYLAQQERRKTINHDFGSYQLKHRAEDLSRKLGMYTHLGNYVSNGMLIAAAYVQGFSVKRASFDSPNARFNISSKTIRATAAHPVITLRQQREFIAYALANEPL